MKSLLPIRQILMGVGVWTVSDYSVRSTFSMEMLYGISWEFVQSTWSRGQLIHYHLVFCFRPYLFPFNQVSFNIRKMCITVRVQYQHRLCMKLPPGWTMFLMGHITPYLLNKRLRYDVGRYRKYNLSGDISHISFGWLHHLSLGLTRTSRYLYSQLVNLVVASASFVKPWIHPWLWLVSQWGDLPCSTELILSRRVSVD